MKSSQKPKLRRQVFVLTPDEKRAIACVVGAFVLGLATMSYRARHPRQPPPPTAAEQREAKRAAARARSSRPSPAAVRTPSQAQRERAASDGEDDQ